MILELVDQILGDLDGEIVLLGKRPERAGDSAAGCIEHSRLPGSLSTDIRHAAAGPPRGKAASGVEHLPPRSCYQSPPRCNEQFRDPDLESSLGHRILVDPAILHNDQKVFVGIFD